MKRIGIMGGTFNPIHKGHLALAEAAMEEFVLDKVIFIPAGMPPHKKPGEVIDKEHRYSMVKMAIKRIPKFGNFWGRNVFIPSFYNPRERLQSKIYISS